MAVAIPPPLAAALIVKRMKVMKNPSGESGPNSSTAVYLSPTVARFEFGKGASFDAQLIDLEAETFTFLFFEKKAAAVFPMRPAAEWLLEKMKGNSLNVELRPTQRTKDFGKRTCREHSARVAISLEHKVTTVTIAPGFKNQWSTRLKPQWQWLLEGKVWLAPPTEPRRDDVRFRAEVEARQLSLVVPQPEHPDWWLEGVVAGRLRAAAARRGEFCAESLTYTPPPWWMRSFLRLGPDRPDELLPKSWTTEILSIEETKVDDDQFVVPPEFKVVPGTYSGR